MASHYQKASCFSSRSHQRNSLACPGKNENWFVFFSVLYWNNSISMSNIVPCFHFLEQERMGERDRLTENPGNELDSLDVKRTDIQWIQYTFFSQ